jgi:hypothetical protein
MFYKINNKRWNFIYENFYFARYYAIAFRWTKTVFGKENKKFLKVSFF